MARESALWQRVKDAGIHLRALGYANHIERIENDVGSGGPDVDGCIDGTQFKIELKSGERPARITSKVLIRTNKRTKNAQNIWHTKRHRAGSRHHWVLVQIGSDHDAKLYLVPGRDYKEVYGTEQRLTELSVTRPTAPVAEILLRATEGYTE